MDFAKKIFEIDNGKMFSFNDLQDPIKILYNQLLLLEDIESSPLPVHSHDKNQMRTCITNSLIKIILSIDVILTDKLFYNPASRYENNHYWNMLLRHFGNKDSVKFINYYMDENFNFKEKGLAWLYIDIFDRDLHNFFLQLYKIGISHQYYKEESLLFKKSKEILDFTWKLNQINCIHLILTKLCREFKLFKERIEFNKNIEHDIDISLIEKRIKVNNIGIISPLISPKKTNINPNKNNHYLNSNIHISAIPSNQPTNLGLTSNLYISGIPSNINPNPIDTNEALLYTGQSTLGELDGLLCSEHKSDRVALKKRSSRSCVRRKSKFLPNNEDYYISKYDDTVNCIKENYFNFEKKPIKTNIIQCITEHPVDKYFKITKKHSKTCYTSKDIVYFNNKILTLKNSVLFYLNHFYQRVEYFKFNTKIPKTLHSLEAQNNQCHFCLRKINKFLFFTTSKVFWCSYYLRYACSDCISNEFSIIPAFILKEWNFMKFSISKKAKDLINKWYTAPILYIKMNDNALKKSFRLRQAVILKRKLHKIFDMMKCYNAENFVVDTLKEYKYFVLKQNFFSMKDLCEINDYSLIYKLQDFFNLFQKHILKDCQVCFYEGGTCIVCANNEVLYSYNIDNVFYCEDCGKIYHKRCCSFHPCLINKY